MGRFYFILILIIAVLLFAFISLIIKYYIKCPLGHVLVIHNSKPDSFGNMTKIIFSGGAFVFPIIGNYQLFSLAPFTIELKVNDAKTKDHKKIQIDLLVIVAITKYEESIQQAIDRISGLSDAQIKILAHNIASAQLRLIVAEMNANETESLKEFINKVSLIIEEALSEVGLSLISIEIKDLKY